MTETIKVNFALQPETVENLEMLCKLTYRSKSDLVDYLVAKEVKEQGENFQAPETLDESIERKR